jgi:hypothetical protein
VKPNPAADLRRVFTPTTLERLGDYYTCYNGETTSIGTDDRRPTTERVSNDLNVD